MKKFTILSILLLSSSLTLGGEIREIKTLEQLTNEVATSNVQSVSNEVKTPVENPEEKVEPTPVEKMTPMDKALARTDIRRVDLSLKTYGEDELVYVKGESKPFTGEFSLFLGDIIESSEAYVDGKLHGEKVWYSHDGNIAMTETYKNNKLEGEQNTFFDNGKLKSKMIYKNNKIIGIEVYDKNGKTLHKDDLSSGNGQWKTFWNSGQVMEEGRYKNWVKDGVWKRYQEDGTVDSITVYEKGRLKSQSWN